MSGENQHRLPQILIFRPPPVFTAHEIYFSKKFEILKAYQSPLPTDLFLKTYAQSVQAVFCSGGTPITPQIFNQLPSLKLVVTDSAGVNHIDLPECRRRGIAVANAGSAFSEDVADVAVGLLIDVLRKITAADRFVRSGLWPVNGEYPLGSKIWMKKNDLQ